MQRINKIQPQFQTKIDLIVKILLKNFKKSTGIKLKSKQEKNIRGYVADSTRGKAFWDGRFTVPYWALKMGDDYFTYYVAHELSHQISYIIFEDDAGANHKKEFYSVFKDVCPRQLYFYELSYKKTARSYGIK